MSVAKEMPADRAAGAGTDGAEDAAARELGSLLGRIAAQLERMGNAAGSDGRPALEEALAAARRAAALVAPAAAPAAPVRPEVESVSPRQTVLVVDDNAGVRRLVVRQLAELGYRALEAEDGPSALMVLNTNSVDLLFTDVVMPGGMSGFDLARLVLSRWPSMKALITSGFPELEPEGSSAAQAKLRRLIKPYRKNDLANALREVLEA